MAHGRAHRNQFGERLASRTGPAVLPPTLWSSIATLFVAICALGMECDASGHRRGSVAPTGTTPAPAWSGREGGGAQVGDEGGGIGAEMSAGPEPAADV